MRAELAVVNNQIAYTGAFLRPPFQLWGHGDLLLQEIFNALSPFGVKLSDIRSESLSADISGQAITANLGLGGVYRFRFDRIEATFFNFAESFFKEFPKLCDSATRWIRKAAQDIEFSSHKFVYSCHGRLGPLQVSQWLNLAQGEIKTAGKSRGSGAIFHWFLEEKAWTTELVLDRSTLVPDGLFLMFTLEINKNDVVFEDVAPEARSYLQTVLSELGLGFARGEG